MNPKKSYKISAVQKIKNKINIKFIIQFINTLTHMNNTFIQNTQFMYLKQYILYSIFFFLQLKMFCLKVMGINAIIVLSSDTVWKIIQFFFCSYHNSRCLLIRTYFKTLIFIQHYQYKKCYIEIDNRINLSWYPLLVNAFCLRNACFFSNVNFIIKIYTNCF